MDESERLETLAANYPSNSKTVKANQKAELNNKKLQKIVTGSVKKQKRGLGKKMSESVLADDARTVWGYILYDVLIPTFKDLIFNTISGGIEMALFGEKSKSHVRRDRGRSYTSYGSYYRNDDRERKRDRSRDFSRIERARHDFDDIVLECRGEAEEVLSRLFDHTIEYGMATVADFYDLVGITSNFTDDKYGWTDLGKAYVSRVRDGSLINLPRPRLLD